MGLYCFEGTPKSVWCSIAFPLNQPQKRYQLQQTETSNGPGTYSYLPWFPFKVKMGHPNKTTTYVPTIITPPPPPRKTAPCQPPPPPSWSPRALRFACLGLAPRLAALETLVPLTLAMLVTLPPEAWGQALHRGPTPITTLGSVAQRTMT